MEAYSTFHQRVVDGRCGPRYLVFRASGVKGLGNQMMALSAALLAAMVSDRAFLIHWLHPVPLTRYLVPTLFNWDAEEVMAVLPVELINGAIDLVTEELCEDLLTLYHHHAVVIHSPHLICPMCSLLFSAAGADGTGQSLPQQGTAHAGVAGHVLPLLLPTPPRFYQLLGQVVSTTMQPTQEFAADVQRKWSALSSCRHVVALQIRRGPRELGWYKVLDAQGEEQVVRCAMQLAHNDSCFVIISDDMDARARAFHALTANKGEEGEAKGKEEVRTETVQGNRDMVVGWVGGGTEQRVIYERNTKLFHSGMDHAQTTESEQDLLLGMNSAFADWFVFTQVRRSGCGACMTSGLNMCMCAVCVGL